jgi:hypothetical protein
MDQKEYLTGAQEQGLQTLADFLATRGSEL